MSLFIYYSYTGSGEIVANYLKNKKCDIRPVIPKKELPKNFFLSMMVGGMLAGMGHKTKVNNFNYELSGYEDIIIGTPIWNGKLACPMNTIMTKIDLTSKRVTFILYSGGGSAPKTVAKLKKKYPNSKIIELKEPKKYQEELAKLDTLFL